MLRIKSDFLTFDSHRYWHLGSMFNGAAYFPSGIKWRAVRIIHGELVGDYRSPYFPTGSSSLGVDITDFTAEDIEGTEGPYTNDNGLSYVGLRLFLDNAPYTGLAYDFAGIYCVGELSYRDGMLERDTKWSQDGQLSALFFDHDIEECEFWSPAETADSVWISEVYACSPDGIAVLASITLGERYADQGNVHVLELELRWTYDGRLSSISSVGERDALEKLIALYSLFPIQNIGELSTHKAAERCLFYHDAAYLFEILARNNAFQTTAELRLPAHFFSSGVGVEDFEHMPELREVFIAQGDGTELETARQLKSRRPDIIVYVPRGRSDDPESSEYVEFSLNDLAADRDVR